MWTEVSSQYHISYRWGYYSTPLYTDVFSSPVSRPITTLDCVILKDNNQALVARSGPEINSPACPCVHAIIPDAVFPSSVSSFF
jgi:hypothetical protein